MSIETRNSNTLRDECRICGAPAEYSYYGAMSCQSCKIFFKRYAEQNEKTFVCECNRQCKINVNNRHICKSCRLAKCFNCGMTTDRLRGTVSKRIKPKTSADLQVHQQPDRFPTLNLLRSDQSLLTTGQWTLLSNLCHCYNESQVLPFTQRLMNTYNTAQITSTMYETLVDEFLVSVYETVGAYLRSNDDIRKLPYDDRCIILRNAADNVFCMGGSFIMQHCLLYGLDTFLSAMNRKYGKHTMDIHIWARKFIGQDVTLIKLAISLFAFSENNCCYYLNTSNHLTNPLHIFEIQNKYADVTWKYLLFKYGFRDAIKRFLNVTLWLISMNVLAVHAQTLAVHVSDIDTVIEETEMKLILDDADEISETKEE